MDRSLILKALEKREPLWNVFPLTREIRIGGDESELGILDKQGRHIGEFHRLPVITPNGGKVYEDVGHVEFCTPETSNEVVRVAYFEAMKQYCNMKGYAHRLYCHCVDGEGNVFGGSHENYFTCTSRKDWPKLIPFLIARTLIAGAGWWVKIDGTPTYEISQRARFITTDVSADTMRNRGIINTRLEPLSEVRGWDRMHVIYSEGTMCEVATFLKVGLMQLVIRLMESRALPLIEYDRSKTVSDLRRVSGTMRDWFLEGVTKGPKGAVELLGCYVRRAKEIFGGQDEVTDAVIIIAEDTLEKLASDPMKLYGRLDWVTKYEVLRQFTDSIEGDTFEWSRSLDMEWHNLAQAEGLYYILRKDRKVERIVSDHLILQAMKEPPFDTRAYVRGKTQQLLQAEGMGRELHSNAWEKICVVDSSFNRASVLETMPEMQEMTGQVYFEEPIPNPFDPGRELLEKIRSRIEKGE